VHLPGKKPKENGGGDWVCLETPTRVRTHEEGPASAGPLPAPPPHADRLGFLGGRAAPAGTAQHLLSKNGGQPDEGQPDEGQPAEMPQMQAPIPAGPLVPQQPHGSSTHDTVSST
jgi:hypothetical protein